MLAVAPHPARPEVLLAAREGAKRRQARLNRVSVWDWPRSGTPITDRPLLERDLDPDEWAACREARRARWYLGAAVFRDPALLPHTPRRAAP